MRGWSYIPISESIAKVLCAVGRAQEDCYFLDGYYRFGNFAVRYRMTTSNTLVYRDAGGLRECMNYCEDLIPEQDPCFDELSDFRESLRVQLRPKFA